MITCRCHAVEVPLRLGSLGIVTLDFEGAIGLRVEALLGPDRGVKLRITGFDVSTTSAVLGRVTISGAESDTTPYSLLELAGANPSTLRATLFLDFTLTLEKPPGGGPPLVLLNKQTAEFVDDNLTTFPPKGAMHLLQRPIDLAPVGEPGKIVAQLLRFPFTVSHKP